MLSLCFWTSCSENQQQSPDKDQKVADTKAVEKTLTLYTSEHFPQDDSLYNQFMSTYKIKVNVIEIEESEMLEALDQGSKFDPADVLIFPEVGMAALAKSKNLLQFHSVPDLGTYYKSMARDEEGYWTGLSRKYPAIAYAKERVSIDDFNSFFDLAEAKWAGKVIIPPADDPYLITLVASFLIHNGTAKTKEWAERIISNAKIPPIKSGKARIKAITAGNGEVTIVNAGDLGQLRFPPTYQELLEGEGAGLIIPANPAASTHVNVSCAAIPVGANVDRGVTLIKYLTRENPQTLYAGSRHEFPVQVMAMPSTFIIEEMGGVREDELELETLITYRDQAIQLLDQVKWPK